jgi:hypothetical protein
MTVRIPKSETTTSQKSRDLKSLLLMGRKWSMCPCFNWPEALRMR